MQDWNLTYTIVALFVDRKSNSCKVQGEIFNQQLLPRMLVLHLVYRTQMQMVRHCILGQACNNN